jgi:hypothetical protein
MQGALYPKDAPKPSILKTYDVQMKPICWLTAPNDVTDKKSIIPHIEEDASAVDHK